MPSSYAWAQAYRALAVACDEESALFQEILDLGGNVRLRPMRRPSQVGSLGDEYSAVNLFLKELEENFPDAYKAFKDDEK